MKSAGILLLILVTSSLTFAQDITGQWNGILKVQGIQLRLVFHILKTDTGFTATMDSPDQNVKGIPVTSTSFNIPVLKFAVTNLAIAYEGSLNKDSTITGTFKQQGQSFPLNLTRKVQEKEKMNRPQEPVKPYPYYAEEVNFENQKEGILLAGTLTLPAKEGNYPAVVLISGSGPQNRDEALLGHKPFLVLSDYLTKNGIAVLRFDDRGTARSKGNFKTATTTDFATDVEAAVAYLQTRKEINKGKIGLIGHSEGGTIAPIVAVHSKDVSFIVLLAGTGIRGDKLLLMQQELIARSSGADDKSVQQAKTINKGAFDIIVQSADSGKLNTNLTSYFKQVFKDDPDAAKMEPAVADKAIQSQVQLLTDRWMQYFIRYDPAPMLEKLTCPVLAINGEKDLQVPAKANLEAIKVALAKGGNKNVSIKELPNLNHLFQECKTGSPDEYASIEQTFSPSALAVVLGWIQGQVK